MGRFHFCRVPSLGMSVSCHNGIHLILLYSMLPGIWTPGIILNEGAGFFLITMGLYDPKHIFH